MSGIIAPPFTINDRNDGLEVAWRPTYRTKKVALFVAITDNGVLQLERVTTVRLDGRDYDPSHEKCPSLDAVPEAIVYAIRGTGRTVAEVKAGGNSGGVQA